MQSLQSSPPTRRPRFRRASEPPAFRVTDDDVAIVRQLAHSPGAMLFLFATRDELHGNDPLAHPWQDGNGRDVRLV